MPIRNVRPAGYFAIAATLIMAVTAAAVHADELSTQVDIPYEVFRLDNGLTTIVHSDHSVPTVFVGMWYGVGSKDEPEGKTGFAHLFEHLMFQGTENRDGEYFSPFTDAGATGMNGTTAEDRTNYYATVPSGALDMALWMESDRMTYLLGAVTQEALDEQRGVVQNEKRQGETRPYALMYDRIREGIYPVGHPYRHSIIGSMEDLDAASLEDVHEWFNTYYGASNVVLVLAGDVDIETAKEKVEFYFGEAPAGTALTHPKEWTPQLLQNRYEVMYDEVGQVRIARVWPLPSLNSKDTTLFYLIGDSLANNKNSPLRRKLVDELQIATAVSARGYGKVMAGEFILTVDLREGVDPADAMAVVDELLAGYLEDGPDPQILENAKLSVNMYMLGALETSSSIGQLLAEGYLYSDDPLFINRQLEWLNAANADEVRDVADRWLSRGFYELTVLPFPEYEVAEPKADRSRIPDVTAVTTINFPEVRETTLDNGMRLVVARRGSIPLVDVTIQIGTGATAEPPDAPGIATFMFSQMDKGTRRFDANELAAAKDRIGMDGAPSAGAENSSFSWRILASNLDESFDLAAEILRNPTFPEEELDKFKARVSAYLATLARAPSQAASSLFSRAIYGPDNPMGGVWTPELAAAIDRDKLRAFHAQEIAPDNMTVYVIGDIEFETAQSAVEDAFGNWKHRHKSARAPVGKALDRRARVILIDHPGSPSSAILAGHPVAPYDADTSTEIFVMNRIIGG
ncbi:MAG: pitrilysin family protein, partial [Woeseiaceae bacterium]|nr:pitrilysin family protein [Woeseiaceae bacterium]